MNRTQKAKDKALRFLNELREYAEAEIPVSIIELSKKHGVDPHFFAYLRKERIFVRKEDGKKTPTWIAERLTPYTMDDMDLLWPSFRRFLEMRKNPDSPVVDRVIVNEETSELQKFSTESLLRELKRRGYTGTLSVVKEIRF